MRTRSDPTDSQVVFHMQNHRHASTLREYFHKKYKVNYLPVFFLGNNMYGGYPAVVGDGFSVILHIICPSERNSDALFAKDESR